MKTLSIIFLSIISLSGYAQYFTVTPGGIKSSIDTTKDYVILSFDSSGSYLYNSCLKYVQRTFKNPDNVQKGNIPNEYLRLDQFDPSIFDFKIKKQRFPINAEYTVELEFSDKIVKYRLMNVSLVATNGVPLYWKEVGNSWTGHSRQHIYDNKGEIEHLDEKKAIEDYFASRVNDIINFIKNKP
jgi:hypothetical protein